MTGVLIPVRFGANHSISTSRIVTSLPTLIWSLAPALAGSGGTWTSPRILFKLSYISRWCKISEMNPLLHRKHRWLMGLLWYSWLPHNGSCQLFVRCIMAVIYEKKQQSLVLCNQKSCLGDVFMACNARKDYYGIMPKLWLIHLI